MEIERILPGVAALDGLIYVVGGEQESKILADGEVCVFLHSQYV